MSSPSEASGTAPASDSAPVSGIPAVCGERARVLVLGSMPGVASLEAAEYYAHPRNVFWDAAECLGIRRSLGYAERCLRLVELDFALWDVLAQCDRKGSLDQAIRNPRPNDFASFAARHGALETIVFNGAKARQLWNRYVAAPDGVRLISLPSTSPANTRRGKLEAWQQLFERLR